MKVKEKVKARRAKGEEEVEGSLVCEVDETAVEVMTGYEAAEDAVQIVVSKIKSRTKNLRKNLAPYLD